MKLRFAAAAIVAAAFTMGLSVEPSSRQDTGDVTFSFSGTAHAGSRDEARRVARRTSRRTARRTSARHNYYNSLPRGCPLRGLYYYCGGNYYQPVVQGGTTVYIIVTP